jgi:hypothetical protein
MQFHPVLKFTHIAVVVSGIRLALRIRGFHRTYRMLNHLFPLSTVSGLSFDRCVDVMHDVAVVCAFFPGRARCLEQSLAGYAILRTQGVDTRLRFGVQPHKVLAHAWVEVGGSPIAESIEALERFVELPALTI